MQKEVITLNDLKQMAEKNKEVAIAFTAQEQAKETYHKKVEQAKNFRNGSGSLRIQCANREEFLEIWDMYPDMMVEGFVLTSPDHQYPSVNVACAYVGEFQHPSDSPAIPYKSEKPLL